MLEALASMVGALAEGGAQQQSQQQAPRTFDLSSPRRPQGATEEEDEAEKEDEDESMSQSDSSLAQAMRLTQMRLAREPPPTLEGRLVKQRIRSKQRPPQAHPYGRAMLTPPRELPHAAAEAPTAATTGDPTSSLAPASATSEGGEDY